MRNKRPIQGNGEPREKDLPPSRADRLEATLNELLSAVRRQPSHVNFISDEAGDLMDAFHRIVVAMERYLIRPTAVNTVGVVGVDESRLARALLITGNGVRFEPCVLLAIREYRIADENVRRFQSAELPEPLKEDLLARFSQQLDSCRQSLELLEVHVFEPAVSEALDPKRHRVTRKIGSESEQPRDLIAEVISPGFEWTNDEGAVRVVPAHVAVQVFDPIKNRCLPKERSAEWGASVPLTRLRDCNRTDAEPMLLPTDAPRGDI